MTINEVKSEISNWKVTRKRLLYLVIGFGSLILHEFVAKIYYRPYIYSHNINDFHIADTLGNSLGTLVAIYIVIGFFGKDKTRDHFLIKMIIISMIVYELAQPLLGKPIDPWDVLATVITGGFCFLLYSIINKNKI